MKRKLSPIYYIIPVLYIGVICFFIFMQFHSREEFSERVGSLSVSGVYAKTLGGGQRMRHLELGFHDLRVEFSSSTGARAGFGGSRQQKLALDSFSKFADGFELVFDDDIGLRFATDGTLDDRMVITAIVPPRLQGIRTLSLPVEFGDGDLEAVKGIPLLVHTGPTGVMYASLGAGSGLETAAGRLVLELESEDSRGSVVLERMIEQSDPYLYWFSRGFPLVDAQDFAAGTEAYLNTAYQYWSGVFSGNPGSRELIGPLGISLLSETIKRGEYRRTLAVLSRNIRGLLRENAENPELYNSAVYLGNLPSFLSTRQNSAAGEIQRITNLITAADFSVFKTPDLICFILNHAPFSLVEEVLRLADSVQLEAAGIDTLIYLIEVYLEAAVYLDAGEATLARVSEIVDRHILPAIRKTEQGLFLWTSGADRESSSDLYESILAGDALRTAGGLLKRDSYESLGRTLIHSALSLSDAEGFLPVRVRLSGAAADAAGSAGEGSLAAHSIYELLPGSDYTPKEYPLYSYLYPGSWVWTACRITDVKIDENRYRFFFSFPEGDTHYLLIQGLRPMSSVILHGIPWKSDPEYFRYTDGWVYDEQSQTFFLKLTHRLDTEELVLNY